MATCPTCQTFRGPWDEACVKCGFLYKELDAQKSASGAKASGGAGTCPACGAVRPAGEVSCPGCGVVYVKWKPREERLSVSGNAPSSSAASPSDSVRKERPGCLTWMMVGSVLINGAATLLLPVIKIPGASTGPLVLISAATTVCAIGVLYWKSWGVYGIALVQLVSIVYMLFSGPSVASMIQPAIVLGLFYHFVSPIWHHFD